jgi:hypothetical protein
MNKSILKKALLLGAVGGLVVLGFQAQKYVRLFLAMRGGSDDGPVTPEEDAAREQELDELLKTGDAVKVRISSTPDDEDDDE